MDIHSMTSVVPQLDSLSSRAFSAGGGATTASSVVPVSDVQTATAVKQVEPVAMAAQVSQALQDINKSMQLHSVGVEFSQDTDSHQTIIKVVDTQTQDVIRQIPSETMLEIAKALDKVQGLLVDAKA